MVMTAAGEMIVPLMGTPASVGLARTLAASRLYNWDYSHILDDALLVISELVTNAVRQTPNEEIRVQVSRDGDGLIIAVWDGDPHYPRPKPRTTLTLEDLDISEEAFDDNGGRGLHIVQAVCVRCGATRDPAGGKWVWARMRP
ncbi:ATP-binding protein [Actinomadura sp. KC06]|uniref:ATP-binding protein n=1 Tax=Actinomadura sp. KC06 TaxID=2530369 RepID=UPI001047AD43|nr:ATP-binding protein [Actinomadura sp. KC06]TDD35974.1 ATP-binding protein [Actinomadura sp. KC06]